MPMQLPGIDTEQALRRMAGNEGLLKRILGAFHKENRETVAKMTALRDQGDMVMLEQLTHTLKGVAGNVGATDLYEAAKHLDEALRRTPPEAPQELLDELFRQLDIVMRGLEQALELPNG